MDKILRRVRMAERQVARRAKRNQERFQASERKKSRYEIITQRRQAGYELSAAIRARHEDLELGPLAPRRDVAKLDSFGNYWGSISMERAMLHTTLTDQQKEARAAWAGGVQYLCLAPGDRVVMIEGPYKGKIATIEAINRETMAVELADDFNRVNAKIPDFLATDGIKPVTQVKQVVPISAVRLVHPLPDPETGVTRDVIIRELKPVGIKHDRPTRKALWGRFVPGLNVRIPWPSVPRTTYEDHPGDTLRLEVEERTFVPTLLRPPMPESVIDELRNRYSKFRTRHTPEYVAKIEAEEAEKQARKKSAETMLLPVQEYNRKMRELRRQRGKPELTTEMLEKIGEIIAKNKLRRAGGDAEAVAADAGAEASADAGVGKIQSAVEQLSIGEGSQAGEEQPRT